MSTTEPEATHAFRQERVSRGDDNPGGYCTCGAWINDPVHAIARKHSPGGGCPSESDPSYVCPDWHFESTERPVVSYLTTPQLVFLNAPSWSVQHIERANYQLSTLCNASVYFHGVAQPATRESKPLSFKPVCATCLRAVLETSYEHTSLRPMDGSAILRARRRLVDALHAMHPDTRIIINAALARELEVAWDAYDAELRKEDASTIARLARQAIKPSDFDGLLAKIVVLKSEIATRDEALDRIATTATDARTIKTPR